MVQVADGHPRDAHAGDEHQSAHCRRVVAAVTCCVTGDANQTDPLVVPQRVGTDAEMRGRRGDVPLGRVVVTSELAQHVDRQLNWWVRCQLQSLAQCLVLFHANRR